jgi:hypothetical protein
VYLSLPVPCTTIIINYQIPFIDTIYGMPEISFHILNYHISTSFLIQYWIAIPKLQFQLMPDYIQFLAQHCKVIRGCSLYFIFNDRFLFGFDNTWTFQIIKRTWHILCKWIMHVHKLRTLCFVWLFLYSIIIIVQLTNMLCSVMFCYVMLCYVMLCYIMSYSFLRPAKLLQRIRNCYIPLVTLK